jgi:hypothetical protein
MPAMADDNTARKADVENKSMQVMPFSMDATQHVFTPTPDGGMQTVVVIDGDANQVPLVRSHLKKEAAAFTAGNFAAPAAIHGAAMPGIKTLSRSPGRMSVHYEVVTNGARIVFLSHDAGVIDALHRWFAAQVNDHGSHAAMKCRCNGVP